MIKKQFKSLTSTGDQNFVEVIRHTFFALVILGGTTAVQFAFDFSLTHTYHASGTGVFYLCFSVLMALALLGRLGVDRAIVRFIPPLLKKSPEGARGVYKSAVELTVFMTLPIAILLFVLSPFVARDIFHSAHLSVYLRVFAVAIPALAMNYVLSGVLRSLKQTRSALSIERLTMYLLGILSVWILGRFLKLGLEWVAIGFVAAIFITTAEGLWYIKRHFPKAKTIVPFSKKTLLITSAPLLFVIFSLQMNGQASLLILGVFNTSRDVGIFNIALKVSMIMNLVLAAVNVVFATKISELHAAGKKEELRTLVSKVSAFSTVIGLPVFILLAVFSTFWLGLFGKEFVTGSSALIIMSAGQLFNISVGDTVFVLAMTAHERALAVAIGVSLAINVGLGFALIPTFGVIGASISTAATLVVSNVIMVLMNKYYLDVWPLPFKYVGIWLNNLRMSKV